jgi:hypothetical protein
MISFICKSKFASMKLLVVHFRIFHLLKSYSVYDCAQESCNQSFKSLNSFKRHCLNKHFSQKTQIDITSPVDDIIHQTSINKSSDRVI